MIFPSFQCNVAHGVSPSPSENLHSQHWALPAPSKKHLWICCRIHGEQKRCWVVTASSFGQVFAREGMHRLLLTSKSGTLPHCMLPYLRMNGCKLQGSSTLGNTSLHLQELLLVSTSSLVTPILDWCWVLLCDFLYRNTRSHHWKTCLLLTDLDFFFAFKKVRTKDISKLWWCLHSFPCNKGLLQMFW